MAFYKRNTAGTTDLTALTAWSTTSDSGTAAASLPTITDSVIWQNTALGGTLTGGFSALGLSINGAATDIVFTSGTINTSTSGIAFGSPSAKKATFSGATSVLNVSTNNQPWALYNPTAGVASLTLDSGSSLQGSATITVSAVGGTAQRMESKTTASTFTGIIIGSANVNIGIDGDSGQWGAATAIIRLNGASSSLYPISASATLASKLDLPASVAVTLGSSTAGRLLTVSGAVSLALTPVITVPAGGATISGAMTGTGGFTLASAAGTLTLDPAADTNTFSGATAINNGATMVLLPVANPTTAGAGRVLGTAPVTINGTVKTSNTSTNFRGQMRYGGNLTLGATAKVYLGGA